MGGGCDRGARDSALVRADVWEGSRQCVLGALVKVFAVYSAGNGVEGGSSKADWPLKGKQPTTSGTSTHQLPLTNLHS